MITFINKKAILSVLLLCSFSMPAISGFNLFSEPSTLEKFSKSIKKFVKNEIKIAKRHMPDMIRGKVLNACGTVAATILYEAVIAAPISALYNVIKNMLTKQEEKTIEIEKKEIEQLSEETEMLQKELSNLQEKSDHAIVDKQKYEALKLYKNKLAEMVINMRNKTKNTNKPATNNDKSSSNGQRPARG